MKDEGIRVGENSSEKITWFRQLVLVVYNINKMFKMPSIHNNNKIGSLLHIFLTHYKKNFLTIKRIKNS